MKCPHCNIDFHDKKLIEYIAEDRDGHWAYEICKCSSPECNRLVIYLIKGEFHHNSQTRRMEIMLNHDQTPAILEKFQIRPIGSIRNPIPPQVPANIAQDYIESCIVLPHSAKASAALSRRCLQTLLRSLDFIKPGDLHLEIQQVLDSKTLPTMLSESIDAIRQIGNFAAHPKKSISTGEIVDVEPGEAEWNLDILESLFDFYFVLPDVLQKKKDALNLKLADIGKHSMK